MKSSARLATLLDAIQRRFREIERTSIAKQPGLRGVTVGDVRVLRAVDRVGVSGVSAVALHLGTSQPAATVAVARLEGRGLVVRAANAADGRRKALSLTTKGRQIEQSHQAADAEAAEMLLTCVPRNDRGLLIDLLEKVAKGEEQPA
jgi:DNA-binding MarR family transcriptional regulator